MGWAIATPLPDRRFVSLMKTPETRSTDSRKVFHRSALLLLLLFSADFLFIALHVVHRLASTLSVQFDIAKDGGYPEIFVYIKYVSASVLLAWIWSKTRCNGYLAWMVVFVYFFADDALKIHERVGGLMALKMEFHPPFNMRLQDFGELAVSAMAGTLLLVFLMLAYWRSSSAFRKVSSDMLVLILLLVFFGVVIDMAHSAIKVGGLWAGALGILEDGGEMVASSLILWYVYALALNEGKPAFFLHDFLRRRPSA